MKMKYPIMGEKELRKKYPEYEAKCDQCIEFIKATLACKEFSGYDENQVWGLLCEHICNIEKTPQVEKILNDQLPIIFQVAWRRTVLKN